MGSLAAILWTFFQKVSEDTGVITATPSLKLSHLSSPPRHLKLSPRSLHSVASQNLRNPQDKEERGQEERKRSHFPLGPRVVSMLSLPQAMAWPDFWRGERQSDGTSSL